ncbi:SigE family RNA polymerase sigma factor [Catellatospora citrea]|uniref:DNA-directed RNA polymerase sigma-70 factor n=1 Tax=Catellatospora citrea TaxID=53366 RepID=A0A8J3P3V4_9ACTN|nr:SigE family RNA polymerase sigma factor [Catellatospora citrea]RKE09077.1 RNA polymerase sigma-70 factor (sigma-E family) [Catellatospora citrea]GIG03031.1 DNA-directed RNA polymerase sigma-70 factor [Catellatospora citrea]
MTEARTWAGDAGYAAFVDEVWVSHLRIATLLCGDRHHAEELLQDCLVKLYPRWRQVAARGDPHAYLRRMLANGKVSWWRRTRREHLTAEYPEMAGPPTGPGEPHEELQAALLALSRQQRAVVVLRHYADLSERQVAAELGLAVGTVKAQHFRAMAKLRELLNPSHRSVERASR